MCHSLDLQAIELLARSLSFQIPQYNLIARAPIPRCNLCCSRKCLQGSLKRIRSLSSFLRVAPFALLPSHCSLRSLRSPPQRAYRIASLRWHPDKNPHGDEYAKQRFHKVRRIPCHYIIVLRLVNVCPLPPAPACPYRAIVIPLCSIVLGNRTRGRMKDPSRQHPTRGHPSSPPHIPPFPHTPNLTPLISTPPHHPRSSMHVTR